MRNQTFIFVLYEALAPKRHNQLLDFFPKLLPVLQISCYVVSWQRRVLDNWRLEPYREEFLGVLGRKIIFIPEDPAGDKGKYTTKTLGSCRNFLIRCARMFRGEGGNWVHPSTTSTHPTPPPIQHLHWKIIKLLTLNFFPAHLDR